MQNLHLHLLRRYPQQSAFCSSKRNWRVSKQLKSISVTGDVPAIISVHLSRIIIARGHPTRLPSSSMDWRISRIFVLSKRLFISPTAAPKPKNLPCLTIIVMSWSSSSCWLLLRPSSPGWFELSLTLREWRVRLWLMVGIFGLGIPPWLMDPGGWVVDWKEQQNIEQRR